MSMLMTPVLDVFGIGARENTYNLWMNLANALATAGAFADALGFGINR